MKQPRNHGRQTEVTDLIEEANELSIPFNENRGPTSDFEIELCNRCLSLLGDNWTNEEAEAKRTGFVVIILNALDVT